MTFAWTHDPKDIEDIVKTCQQSGMPLPDFIKNQPELMFGLDIFVQAFWDLSTCRQMGMGLGPIPWISIQEYCIMLQCSEDFTKDLHYHIRRIDQAYLNWASESNKEKPK